MSAPVIIATHDDNVVRIWTRHPDGSVHQTGRFVTYEPIDPPYLAELVSTLADTFHWTNGTTPAPAPVVQAIKAAPVKAVKKKDNFRTRPRAGQDVIEQRRATVMTHLIEHGDATAPELGAALFSDLPDSVGKARKLLDQLTDTGLVTRVPSDKHGTPMRFRAVVT
jgi:transaldolase